MKGLGIVERETDAHERPVADMLARGQICFKYKPHTHGIAAVACGVDRGAERVLELELVRLGPGEKTANTEQVNQPQLESLVGWASPE